VGSDCGKDAPAPAARRQPVEEGPSQGLFLWLELDRRFVEPRSAATSTVTLSETGSKELGSHSPGAGQAYGFAGALTGVTVTACSVAIGGVFGCRTAGVTSPSTRSQVLSANRNVLLPARSRRWMRAS
jgi:hypothetical protein